MSMPVIETIASCNKLQQKKSLELAWDPLTGESLVDQVLRLVFLLMRGRGLVPVL